MLSVAKWILLPVSLFGTLDNTVNSIEMGESSANAPILYWPMKSDFGHSAEEMANLIAAKTDKPFMLAAFEVDEWNSELSPWPAQEETGNDEFSGNGPSLLTWLLEDYIPSVEGSRSRIRAIGGYSMAGLFAAWAFLESDAFSAMASCSGSLWYPGWLAWASEHQAPRDSFAYLSLGTKEYRVKNPLVATVEAATLETADLFASDSNVCNSTFEWNPGGHFTDPNGRMAAGFAWLIDHLS